MEREYLEYRFCLQALEPARDVLLAVLAEAGFESFVETPKGLLAYVAAEDWRAGMLDGLQVLHAAAVGLCWTVRTLAPQNWNAVWEAGFAPIRVGTRCRVRAPFHPAAAVAYDIVIAPRMSFGTGHHETTQLMLQQLLDMDCAGKAVLDMGCGTGVLAILAHKQGAARVVAVDVDAGCVANAQANAARNGCDSIRVCKGDSRGLRGQAYDVILANITRNVVLKAIPRYAECLTPGGVLVLSGFYTADLEAISNACAACGLGLKRRLEKHHWVAARYGP